MNENNCTRRLVPLVITTLSALILFVAGCSTVGDKGAKGYVEFYGASAFGAQIPIYEMKDGKSVHLGNAASWMPSTRLRIASDPGPHTYRADLYGFVGTKGLPCEPLTVNVQQDLVTSIRIERVDDEGGNKAAGKTLEAINLGMPSVLSSKFSKFHLRLIAEQPVAP